MCDSDDGDDEEEEYDEDEDKPVPAFLTSFTQQPSQVLTRYLLCLEYSEIFSLPKFACFTLRGGMSSTYVGGDGDDDLTLRGGISST